MCEKGWKVYHLVFHLLVVALGSISSCTSERFGDSVCVGASFSEALKVPLLPKCESLIVGRDCNAQQDALGGHTMVTRGSEVGAVSADPRKCRRFVEPLKPLNPILSAKLF